MSKVEKKSAPKASKPVAATKTSVKKPVKKARKLKATPALKARIVKKYATGKISIRALATQVNLSRAYVGAIVKKSRTVA